MMAIQLCDAFGLEHLAYRETPVVAVGPGQIRVALKAASLNFRDFLMVQGLYNPRQVLPLIPGSDGCGEVTEVGEGVDRVAVGDRVTPTFAQEWIAGEPTYRRLRSTLGGPLDGTFAQEIVVSAQGVVHAPDHLSDMEAACLPCAGLTAWSAISTEGQVQAGETVLVQGTGGVALFALQFANLLGARVIVTSSSDEKLERARSLGAAETINYKSTPDWGKRAAQLTEGRGVDLVVEVGGAGTLSQSLKAVRFGGRIMVIGILAGTRAPVDVVPILMRKIRLQGILVGNREGFEAMNRALSVHQLRPVVDSTFPLAEAQGALTQLSQGRHFGKICLTTTAAL